MPTIPISDNIGATADIDFDNSSDVQKFGLKGLKTQAGEFLHAAGEALDQTSFVSAVLGPIYQAPAIQVAAGVTLTIENDSKAAVRVFRHANSPLFGSGEASPGIPIGDKEAWVCFSLDTLLSVAAGLTMPSGFGICGTATHTRSVSNYALIQPENGHFPTLKESVGRALSGLKLFRSAHDIRNQASNTVQEWDVSGTLKVSGKYCVPLAMNKFSLAGAKLPFGQQLQIGPKAELSLTGSLAVTGEFRGRCYRRQGSSVQLGLYKKKESDLSATFKCEAGIQAQVASTDLISALFAELPGADLKSAQMPDADRKEIDKTLNDAVDQGFSIALNSCCSASVADEIAVLYEVDLSQASAETDAALNAALSGDWTALSKLGSARELRNIAIETHDTKAKTSLNLLGVYDYASVQDFVRKCTILHNLEDGTITVTDQETAKRIAVSSMPFKSDDQKLRKVVAEAFLATVVYAASNTGTGIDWKIEAAQSLMLYKEQSNLESVRKNLLLGVALGLLTEGDLGQLPPQAPYKYFRLAARVTFEGQDVLRLFFSDVPARTERQENDLKRLGRQVLVSLLDRNIPADRARSNVLNSDAQWEEMEQQKFPADSPASYSDWFDIATWASAIAGVAPRLSEVLGVMDNFQGADPTKDPSFMTARKALAKALSDATHDTRAAFEKGWPIAVMVALTGRNAPVSFEAQWDGKKQFERQSVKVLTA